MSGLAISKKISDVKTLVFEKNHELYDPGWNFL